MEPLQKLIALNVWLEAIKVGLEVQTALSARLENTRCRRVQVLSPIAHYVKQDHTRQDLELFLSQIVLYVNLENFR